MKTQYQVYCLERNGEKILYLKEVPILPKPKTQGFGHLITKPKKSKSQKK